MGPGDRTWPAAVPTLSPGKSPGLLWEEALTSLEVTFSRSWLIMMLRNLALMSRSVLSPSVGLGRKGAQEDAQPWVPRAEAAGPAAWRSRGRRGTGACSESRPGGLETHPSFGPRGVTGSEGRTLEPPGGTPTPRGHLPPPDHVWVGGPALPWSSLLLTLKI